MQIKVTLFAIVFGFAARAQAACSSSAIDASYNSAFAACGNIPLASLTLGGDGFNSGAPLVCNLYPSQDAVHLAIMTLIFKAQNLTHQVLLVGMCECHWQSCAAAPGLSRNRRAHFISACDDGPVRGLFAPLTRSPLAIEHWPLLVWSRICEGHASALEFSEVHSTPIR